MTDIIVDIESDGPAPGLYSMVCFGAVILEEPLHRTFYGTTSPIVRTYLPEALRISGFTREQHELFDDPMETMLKFDRWIQENCTSRPMFYSDNNGFDWQFINWYFWKYLGRNPFGHSSSHIGCIYKGLQKDMFANFKHLRKTTHDHNPVNDAKGNAEALLAMRKLHNLKMPLGR
jgi:hypothetical protein